MGYRIKTVSEMLHIPRNTLLAWERRYQVVCPARQENGYREYSESDVTRLRDVKRLIDEGYKVSEAISMLQVRDRRPAPARDELPTLKRIQIELLESLLRFDRANADEVLQRTNAVSFRQQIEAVFFPMLREVGEGWCNGEVSIAQEHYISAYCRERMVAMLLSLECGPRYGPLVICAGFPGERHDLSLIALSVLLAMRGKRILFLGADVPCEDLQVLVKQQNPDMTCVSTMMPRTPEQLRKFATGLSSAGKGRVVLGGRGLPPKGDLPIIPNVEWHHSMDTII
jgi:DNA-binding transcriptional MerR regulator